MSLMTDHEPDTTETHAHCADCLGYVEDETAKCEHCDKPLCEGCTDHCLGFAGSNVCRDCHSARCRTRECWED